MHLDESFDGIALTCCLLEQLYHALLLRSKQSLHLLLNGIIWHSSFTRFIERLENLWGSGIHPLCSALWRVIPHSLSDKRTIFHSRESRHWLPDLQLAKLCVEFLHHCLVQIDHDTNLVLLSWLEALPTQQRDWSRTDFSRKKG